MALKTVFLHPPSFDGFDGGAGGTLSGQARGALVLVPDLARAAGGSGAGQCADRRATDGLTLADVMRAVKDADLDDHAHQFAVRLRAMRRSQSS